jgi:hypothetical protein
MFIQVIEGHATDADHLRRSVDQWVQDLSPGATGWLGSTGGVTEDGRFIAVVRFASAEAAQANSDRPEQGAWWADTEKGLSGDVTFHDCADVTQMGAGGSDRAGFVQVMQSHPTDLARLREMGTKFEGAMGTARPDLLGITIAVDANGDATQVAYFSSEAEARAAESQPPPPEMAAEFEEMGRLMGEVEYFDLKEPWLHSPIGSADAAGG